jgi:hypothetical protein
MRGVGVLRVHLVWLPLVGVVLLASCGGTSGQGTLSGHLYVVGGPLVRGGAAGSPRPVAGTVVANGSGGAHTATARADGRYAMQVPPGTYTVTGTSRQYNDGNSACPASGKIMVVRDQVRTADVYCQVP